MIARFVCVACVMLALSFSAPVSADSYVVLAKKDFSSNFSAQIQQAHGTVSAVLPEIGVAIVQSESPDFRADVAGLPGIRSVAANISTRVLPRQQDLAAVSFADAVGDPPASGDDDFFHDLQWDHTAIDVADAWAAGSRGAGVRVAILDSGIDADHPDLAPNLNVALSRSFVPGEDWNVQPGFYFNHGTHVAGIIAAADNGYGTIGVAPDAEIVAIKVLSEYDGRGSFGGILQGMYYAGQIGAQVVNMSLGMDLPRNCTFDVYDDAGQPTGETVHYPAKDCAELFVAGERGVKYLLKHNALVFAAAGNDARDLDHDQSLKTIPAELPGVVTVSATGPKGWALNPYAVNLDRPASYTSYGQSAVDLAGPGGDFAYYYVDPAAQCTIVLTAPCWNQDMVFSTISGGWGWSAGTSMATPHATAVAALAIAAHGGNMPHAALLNLLRQSADDLGRPGNDDYYGQGRINAYRAVTE